MSLAVVREMAFESCTILMVFHERSIGVGALGDVSALCKVRALPLYRRGVSGFFNLELK